MNTVFEDPGGRRYRRDQVRLRNVPGAREMIAADPLASNDEAEQKELKGCWKEKFGNRRLALTRQASLKRS